MKRLNFLLTLLMLFLCSCLPNNHEVPTVPIVPDTTTPKETISGEPSLPQTPHEHLFEPTNITVEPTCTEAGEYIATCSCGAEEKREIPATGKHNYRDNACAWCQKTELSFTAVSSGYDIDGDGKKETYYFSSKLAQRCKEGVYLWAGDYDNSLSTKVNKTKISGIQHWYVDPDGSQQLVYRVTVPTSGVYEMIIHTYLKTGETRGAKYIINAGKPWQETFQTSHSFSDSSYMAVCDPSTFSSYMYGIKVELVAGENTITITAATNSPKTQHYREFYFVKVDDFHIESHTHNYTETTTEPATCSTVGKKMVVCPCGEVKTLTIPATREHTYVDGICVVCKQKKLTMIPVSSTYDADGDGQKDSYEFSPVLLDICKTSNAVHVWAGDYDKGLSSATVSTSTIDGLKHWYLADNDSEYLVYRVTVPETGEYEMILHLRVKDRNIRGAKFLINEGTAFEQRFSVSHAFETGSILDQVRDTNTFSTYMYGIKVHLQEGENHIKIVDATTSKCPHFRDFYFVKVAEIHHHLYETELTVIEPTCGKNGERILACACGETISVTLPATNKHIRIDDACFKCGNKGSGFGIVDYSFLFDTAGFAGGIITFLPEKSGFYTFYWGDESGVLPDYTMLYTDFFAPLLATQITVHAQTAIPQDATRLLVANGSGVTVYVYDIPIERQFTKKEIYSFGALSDTHQGTRYGDESQSVEKLINAGKILSQKGAIMVGINGDVINDNTENEYILHSKAIKQLYSIAPNLPVWCTSGNHEAAYIDFPYDWYMKYTRNVVDYDTDLTPIFADGNSFDFVIEMPDGSVIVFLHQLYYDYTEDVSSLLADYQLDWLEDRLEEYKDRTVFLFFHTEMEGKVGDLNESTLVMRTDAEDYRRKDANFKQYTNVVFFNGHSHGSFNTVFSEQYGDRIFNTYNEEYATLVHIPALADAVSDGYIVHVYDDCIVFEGYDFTNQQTFAYATFIIVK